MEHRIRSWPHVFAALLLLQSCSGPDDTVNTKSGAEFFGVTPSGDSVFAYTLRNAAGLEARILTYGAILQSLSVPDWWGEDGDIVLGYETLDGYLRDRAYFGAIVGRCANRIARGTFTIGRRSVTLATNNGPNHLHGGVRGFDKAVWTVDEDASVPGRSLVLDYVSPDGEEGYPGTLTVRVIYTLTEDNSLRIDYGAQTDATTIVNLSHHSYFNLANGGAGSILEHELMIAAEKFTPVDSTLIPTGELRPVEGTVMDFRSPRRIGDRINADDEQLHFAGGYDHNWVLARPGPGLMLAARLREQTSGRSMEVHTTEPGLQFYSGNFLDGTVTGKRGITYGHRSGLCLETQHFPDAPNHDAFPSTVLQPGEKYSSTTVYRFLVDPKGGGGRD
jgi:aldose 1-epimerase